VVRVSFLPKADGEPHVPEFELSVNVSKQAAKLFPFVNDYAAIGVDR
jgi:hypothetical protein